MGSGSAVFAVTAPIIGPVILDVVVTVTDLAVFIRSNLQFNILGTILPCLIFSSVDMNCTIFKCFTSICISLGASLHFGGFKVTICLFGLFSVVCKWLMFVVLDCGCVVGFSISMLLLLYLLLYEMLLFV